MPSKWVFYVLPCRHIVSDEIDRDIPLKLWFKTLQKVDLYSLQLKFFSVLLGLDDYPRSPVPSEEEFHVDLFSWMARSVAIMARLESVLEEYYSSSNSLNPGGINSKNDNRIEKVEVSTEVDGEQSRVTPIAFDGVYRSTAEYLADRLVPLHWSEKHQGT